MIDLSLILYVATLREEALKEQIDMIHLRSIFGIERCSMYAERDQLSLYDVLIIIDEIFM